MFKTEELFDVTGRTIFISGGSRGIGLMMAKAYVANGARVYISSRKAQVCQAVADELSTHGTCVAIPADLSQKEEIDRTVSEFKKDEGSLDVLINNAGTNWMASIEAYSENGYDKVLDLNVRSPFFLTQAFLPLLEASAYKPARVINVGSIDGLTVSAFDTYAYGTSKAALHHLTRMLAVKLGPRGISVNAMAPGPFESKMTDQMLQFYQEKIEKSCPLKRIGQASDMAGLALYMAAPASAYLNGAVIPLDGGLLLKANDFA